MSRLDTRLAKLETVKDTKPVIWAFVARPDSNLVSERDKDKEMLREFASRYFGITDFYFSVFTPPKATNLSFSYIEAADFDAIIKRASSKGSRVNEASPPPEETRERNEILADYLERFLFEDEAA